MGTGNLAKLFLTDLGLFLEAAHRGEGRTFVLEIWNLRVLRPNLSDSGLFL